MEIIGLGTDIVEVSRVKKALEKPGFRDRVFTLAEQLAGAEKKESASYYSGRWAAKEALAKALGCGIGKNCSFTDIQILNEPSGKPAMLLAGAAEIYANSLGVKVIKLSISHESSYAVATVILCG